MGGHDWLDGFDRRVCDGTHAGVEGVCPEKTGTVVDRCGVCGCTIFGLALSATPPTDCVRREKHRVATDGGAPASVEYTDQESPVDRFFDREGPG